MSSTTGSGPGKSTTMPGGSNDRIRTNGKDFGAEQRFLSPPPGEVFDAGLVLTPQVNRSSRVTARMVKYSAPARFVGRRLRLSLRASEVVVFGGRAGNCPASTDRCQTRAVRPAGSLPRGPQNQTRRTPRSTALAQARESRAFTSAHETFWATTCRVIGDADGIRELIHVRLLRRSMDSGDIQAGITAAVGVRAVSAHVVAV